MKLTATLDVLLRDLPKILAAGVEVAEVEVSKKEPHSDDGLWVWYVWLLGDVGELPPWYIPGEILKSIPPGEKEKATHPWRVFKTADEARKALSDAVIVWATQQNQ